MRLPLFLLVLSACSRVEELPSGPRDAPSIIYEPPLPRVEAGATDAAPAKPLKIHKPNMKDEGPSADLHIKPSEKPLPNGIDACTSKCAADNKENDAGADLVRFTCRKLCVELCVVRCEEEKTVHDGTCKRVCSGAT